MKTMQARRGRRRTPARRGPATPLVAAALAAVLAVSLVPATAQAAKKKNDAKGGAAAEEVLAPVFYPALPQPPRYQFLGTVTTTRHFKPKKGMKTMLFGDTRKVIDIERAYGLAMQGGKLYVCDTAKHMGIAFDLVNEEATLLNVDHPQYQLSEPINITLLADGRKFLTDPRGGKILVLDATDEPTRVFVKDSVVDLGGSAGGLPRADDCERASLSPVAVGVHGDELFVLDITANKVFVLDLETGCLKREFGEPGAEEGQLMKPTNLVVGPDGYVYVSDTVNARVQKFDRQGRHVRTYGSRGAGYGEFVRPKGIAVDKAGRLYVVDAAFEAVQVFDADGRLLLVLGQPGQGRGGLALPAGIAIADDAESIRYASALAAPGFEIEYLVLVSNHWGPNKVNLYAFGQLRQDQR